MNRINRILIERKKELSIALLFFVSLFLFVFPKFVDKANNSVEYLFYNVAGESAVDTNIVIIKITEQDISALGGWPLKRSYYALLLSKLNEYDVSKIGIEVFFTANNSNQKIYNNLIIEEIKEKNNVLLSAIVNNLNIVNKNFVAESLLLPEIKETYPQADIGHINFITDGGIIIPQNIKVGNVEVKSFSHALANNLNYGRLKLNFYSSFSKFRSYSLLDFFTASDNDKEIKTAFKNKIVLIGVTDPTIGKSISTPFDERLAGIGLHAFAVSNIIYNNGLNYRYIDISTILFFLFFAIIIVVIKTKKYYFYLAIFIIAIITFYLLFTILFIELNYSAFLFPLFLLILFELYIFYLEREVELDTAFTENELLQKTILQKVNLLDKLEKELSVSTEPEMELLSKIELLKNEIQEIKLFNKANETPHELESNLKEKNFLGIIYAGKVMDAVATIIKKVAPTDASVLIIGDSGSGKELVANAIHQLSNRKEKKIVAFNCAAMPENLLESELFGHVKGAFTDASKDKIGKFEAANNGTIFLDEIGETTNKFQAKLLRVLQSGEFQKVGSTVTQIVDVRVIAATNKNLSELVKEKKFRKDLYYRLNVITIEVPSLDKRKEDIPFLAQYFAEREDENIKISDAVMGVLKEHKWSGNVRELKSLVMRASIFAKSEGRKIIQLCDLPENIAKKSRKDLRQLILDSLRKKNFSHSSISETAKELGNISRTIVSENYRGIFFEEYYKANFNFNLAIKTIGQTENPIVIKQISKKGKMYLRNIEKDLESITDKSFEFIKQKFSSKYKNLPQKYHFYLDRIIERITENTTID